MFSYISSKYPNANLKPHLLGSKIYPIKSLVCKNMCMQNLFAKIWARIAIGWVPEYDGQIWAIYWFDAKIEVPEEGIGTNCKNVGPCECCQFKSCQFFWNQSNECQIYRHTHILAEHILALNQSDSKLKYCKKSYQNPFP